MLIAHKSVSKDGKRKVGQDTEGNMISGSVVRCFCILLISPYLRKHSLESLLACFKLDQGLCQQCKHIHRQSQNTPSWEDQVDEVGYQSMMSSTLKKEHLKFRRKTN